MSLHSVLMSSFAQSPFVIADRLKIRYSRSSGPGGQHVNKGNQGGYWALNEYLR